MTGEQWASAGAPFESAGATKKRSRWVTVGVPIAAGLLAMGVGSGAGAAGAQNEIEDLRASEAELVQQLDRAEAQTEKLEAQLGKAKELVESQSEREESLRSAVTQHEEEKRVLAEEKTTLADQNAQLTARIAELESAAATAPAAAAAPPPAAPVPLAEAPSGSTSAYYANCSEARAAGAAPLYSGSAGYGRHLDRDGDGVACE